MAETPPLPRKIPKHHDTRRPSSRGKNTIRGLEPGTAFGRFAFAPATQTTVVTTTTTTTTKFPPFLMRPPRRSRGPDQKQYPLALVPTPASLRTISFLLDGKLATFSEAEDTNAAIQQSHEEFDSLEHAGGVIRRVENSDLWTAPETQGISRPFTDLHDGLARPVSPESIAEEESESGPLGVRRNIGAAASKAQASNIASKFAKRHPSLRRVSGRFPITPYSINRQPRPASKHILENAHETEQVIGGEGMLPSPYAILPNPKSGSSQRQSSGPREFSLGIHPTTNTSSLRSHSLEADDFQDGSLNEGSVVPTPPVESDDQRTASRPSSRRNNPSLPSRLSIAEATVAQDGSLPSPSLSPVTAAASAPHNGYFADVDSTSEFASQHDQDEGQHGEDYSHTSPSSAATTPAASTSEISNRDRLLGSTIPDLSLMFDYFEAIPDELKSYVMHQLLRRCPKATLHVVADTVNPALKCDFLTALPPELALNILKFLDLRSLCKASQVSKKWRQMINGDERAWKQLFDNDGFALPDGELQRAITEGWGWQDPYGADGYEEDLSLSGPLQSDSDGAVSVASADIDRPRVGDPTKLRRSKRKAVTALSNRRKQAKKKGSFRNGSTDVHSVDFMAQISTAEGPYNAANAAILAVPQPKVGLPSLKGLHLYKSLYRRHYLIRKNWMAEDTKPHHIAFRAHDRHVVTCLQFDTDKILTGSDDNNIHVYDTKTGALRAKLEGHEGGVWALQYEGNTLVSGSTDRSVRVWNIERGIETQVFRGHTSTVRCLQIVSPVKIGETADGKPIMMPKFPLIITGSRDSTLRVWKLPQPGDPNYIQPENAPDDEDCPYFIRTLTGHSHSVRALAAHADILVSGSYDSSVRVWKISTGETVYRLQGHSAKVYSVVLDYKRNRCISGSMDNLVKIWSLDTGSLIHTLDGHSSLVGLLDLNCERLVSAAADSTLRIWEPESGQCKATLSAHTGAITCFQHDAQKVISGSDRTLKMWNVKTGECVKDLLSDLSGVWQVKFNERRCVAAVQRENMTYIEVLDFGAARDGVPESKRGRRIVVNAEGLEIVNEESGYLDLDGNADG